MGYSKMITLHTGSGAQDFTIEELALSDSEWEVLKYNVSLLLKKRNFNRAAEVLLTYNFKVYKGTNFFNDEFCVLYYESTMDEYIKFEEIKNHPDYYGTFYTIAKTINEIGPFIRFIAVGLDKEYAPETVPKPEPIIDSYAVELALADAENLLRTSGAVSAVDRIHTALHPRSALSAFF